MEGLSGLDHAARDGDLDRVRELAARDAPPAALAAALRWAAERGHAPIVEHLLDLGVDVNAGDARGWTALHHAAESRQRHIVVLLLDRGADVNARTSTGVTPLHSAVSGALDQAVAETDETGACVPPAVGLVETLLARGANPSLATVRGRTAADQAARHPGAQALLRLLTPRGGADQ